MRRKDRKRRINEIKIRESEKKVLLTNVRNKSTSL